MAVTTSGTTYAILGCGSVGHAVAEELVAAGGDVHILDRDEGRVEALRDQDLDARVVDITDPAVVDAVADRDVVLVLASDPDANAAAIEAIRAAGGDHFVVARASDPVSADELEAAGADVVITPSEVIAESALRALESGQLERRARRLARMLEDCSGRLLVRTHDDPDPDAIAAAVALRTIAAEHGVDADVVYDGDLGHREDRAFVNLLGLELTPAADADDPATYDLVAYVDRGEAAADDAAADESAPPPAAVDILLDHHGDDDVDAAFSDVRSDVAATSTILTKYVQEYDVRPSAPVATALLYGIRSETVDFRRGTTPADLTAAAYLHPFADHDALEQIESPSMSPETLDVLAEAIRNRTVAGSHLVSNAGSVRDAEPLARAAQHLLDLEGVATTVVFGVTEDQILLSARSRDIRLNVGAVLETALGDAGETSGHATQGTATVPLGIFTGIGSGGDGRAALLDLAEEAVTTRLFDAMGVGSDEEAG